MSAEFEKIVLEKFNELNQKIDANTKSINNLSNELHEVKEKVDNLEGKVNSNTNSISTLARSININTDLMATLSKQIEKQGLNLASFEDEFTTKIQALFDSFVSNTESHLAYEKSISVLHAKSYDHNDRISILENYFKTTNLLATN